MSSDRDRSLIRSVLTVVWGMVTLVLLFCVALLVYQMMQRGQSPLAQFEPAIAPRAMERTPEPSAAVRHVQLYFADPEARALAPDVYSLEFSDYTVQNCRHALDALIRGPRGNLTPILPPATKIHAVYLLESGELVIDFSRDLVLHHPKSASAEALMIHGIVNTVTQSALKGQQEPGVKCVRFLIEGAAPPEIFPGHFDLSQPIAPDARWVARAGGFREDV
ncbi:MAG TPA: GerMN domain-containing protein [Candidatus Hydrogenedentes bacterium]|nr:GerMN domain-containing protein [Candidatus Hydrogenedentota bacterium]HIJ74366.1 GerMN domain-containing protein [Candidatus Hydrogenedentota bacterium]